MCQKTSWGTWMAAQWGTTGTAIGRTQGSKRQGGSERGRRPCYQERNKARAQQSTAAGEQVNLAFIGKVSTRAWIPQLNLVCDPWLCLGHITSFLWTPCIHFWNGDSNFYLPIEVTMGKTAHVGGCYHIWHVGSDQGILVSYSVYKELSTRDKS